MQNFPFSHNLPSSRKNTQNTFSIMITISNEDTKFYTTENKITEHCHFFSFFIIYVFNVRKKKKCAQ